MNFKNKVWTALVLAALSTSAAAANKGTYFDLGFGISSSKCAGCGTSIDNGFGGKFAFGVRANDNFAIEGGLAGGSGSLGSADTSTNTFFAAVLGIYPVTKNFEVFGRLGLGITKSVVTLGNTDYESDNKGGALFGLGFGFTPDQSKITWRVEFNRLASDTTNEDNGINNNPLGSSLFSIGAVVGF